MQKLTHTEPSPLLDYQAPAIQTLIAARDWCDLSEYERIGAAYDYVRNEVLFGYNKADNIPASEVLADGYGQCNTKGTLLMALLRALSVPCRVRGLSIHKALQRGVIPELIYRIAPASILHSWVEVYHSGRWINLEGFILDQSYLGQLQKTFGNDNSLCGYGVGTDQLNAPDVDWCGQDTYIQRTGVNQDFGVFETPDEFYAGHQQDFSAWKNMLYKTVFRHWINARVRRIRKGYSPHSLPPHSHGAGIQVQ